MTGTTRPLGIDIGGSGVKGAPVDLDRGEFATARHRIEMPPDSSPEVVLDLVEEICGRFSAQTGGAPVGITVPGVVTAGVVRTAANIDRSWIDTDAEQLFSARLGREVCVLNDADAAGVAERQYGAGRGCDGLMLMTTLGTGIGTALINRGVLLPNAELGHLELDGEDAETRAANRARQEEDLSWPDWAARLQRYYSHLEQLFWPDLIVVGGGVSKKADRFLPLLDLRAPIVPAELRNDAGIIGAGWAATHRERAPER